MARKKQKVLSSEMVEELPQGRPYVIGNDTYYIIKVKEGKKFKTIIKLNDEIVYSWSGPKINMLSPSQWLKTKK